MTVRNFLTNNKVESVAEMKDNILAELEKENPDVNMVNKKSLEFLQYLILRMVFNDETKFMGNILMRVDRESDINFKAEAGVTIQGTNIFLKFNPRYLLLHSIAEMEAILIHEVYHLINDHIRRFKEYKDQSEQNFDYANIAMDFAINQFIKGLPKGVIDNEFMEWFMGEKVNLNQPFEYYYDLMMNKRPPTQKVIVYSIENNSGNDNGNANSSSNSNNSSDKNGSEKGEETDGGGEGENVKGSEKNKKQGRILGDHKKWKDMNNFDELTAKQGVLNIVEEVINEMSKSDRTRGLIPANIMEMIKALKEEPQIRWQAELKKATASIRFPSKKTILRRNTLQPNRLDLKGKVADRKCNVIIAVDTSGSMSDGDLSTVFTEVFNIVDIKKTDVTIIECDAKIQNIYHPKKLSEVTTKVKGRGGTRFSPVFEYINELKNNKYPDILFYFTDGYGELEIPKPKKPLYIGWVVNLRKDAKLYLSVEKPYGKVYKLYVDK